MKVAFVQTGDSTFLVIMNISAVLKKHGYSTDVFSTDVEGEAFIDNLMKAEPDIVACSASTATFKRISEVIKDIKKIRPDLFVIVGGCHPTFYPEILEQKKEIDAICRGEGEYAMLDLASSLERRELDTAIKNLWIRKDGKIFKNDVRNLADLNTLPFPDRDLYLKYPFMLSGTVRFMISRGCPFNCSYCFNKQMKSIYRNKGSWLRFKSLDRSIEEIKDACRKYPIKWISFIDDTFNVHKDLKEFLRIYKQEVNIPFICQLRVDITTEEHIQLLKEAGVDRVNIGIEHGDEEYRRRVLNRRITNEQYINFGKWVSDRKIRLSTQNIIGFPEDTVEKVFMAAELNTKMKPEIADTNILTPYPGTDIYTYIEQNNYLKENFDFNKLVGHSNWYIDSGEKLESLVKNEHMSELINLRCFFQLLVKYPWLKPLITVLIKFPYNRFYEFIWHFTGNFKISWPFCSWKERRVLMKRLLLILMGKKRS